MEVAEGSFFDLALLPDLATFLDHFFAKMSYILSSIRSQKEIIF